MRIDIRQNVDAIIGKLKTNQAEQIPFATALALTKAAQIARDKLSEMTTTVFDRPTPYTRNAFYVRPATKKNLVASVGIKDFAPKGTPAAKYLRSQIEGGDGRNTKRMERALQSKGLMPQGSYAVPGAQAPLDAYGNVPASFIVRMLSDLQAFGEQGYSANRKGDRRGAKRSNYFFVPRRGSSLKPGIYWHMPGGMLGVVFRFVSQVAYRKRFDFYEAGRKIAVDAFDEQFRLAWLKALATAR
jgi:hypothetical protein